MRNRLALLATVLALGLLAVPAAGADAVTDATTAATTFSGELFGSQVAAACAMTTPAFLARVGGSVTSCVATFSSDQTTSQDSAARVTLLRGWVAAVRAANDQANGRFPVPARRLARELQARLSDVRVVIGRGPGAAHDVSTDTLVLDSARSTRARVVLYDESDSGQIWRLAGGLEGFPTVDRAAKGVPAPVPPVDPPAAQIVSADLTAGGDAHVVLDLTKEGQTIRVLVVLAPGPTGTWLVDDLDVSLLSLVQQPL